jgi:rhodanese-related sulfurtransferase
MRVIFLVFAFAVGAFQPAINPLSQDVLKGYLKSSQAPFDFILVDVRGAEEITAAIGSEECKPYNLAWPDQFKDVTAKIPKDVAIIVYCRSGSRSARAAAFLDAAGYANVYDAGGFLTWNGSTVPASDIKPTTLLPEPSLRKAK